MGGTLALVLGLLLPMIVTLPAKAADTERITVRVAVINLDPIIESSNGQRLHQAMRWQDPSALARAHAEDVRRASHGLVDYQIVQWTDLDLFPKQIDGFQYDDETYLQAVRTNTPHLPETADYPLLLESTGAVDAINSGVADEIWYFGGAWFGLAEASMAGPGSFFTNGGVYPDVPTTRAFAIMGFNYERSPTEMLHNLCHRTEGTMRLAYGGWNRAEPVSNWDRFTAVASKSSGPAGVGDCHFPPNGVEDYDYDNTTVVASEADDWLNYPALTGAQTDVSVLTWRTADESDQHSYLMWWFARLPHAVGTNADGKMNNWWRYVFRYADPTGEPGPAPLAPLDVKVRALGGTQLEVSWTPGEDTSGVEVSDGTTTWSLGPNVSTHTVSGLAPGTTVCFRVRAVNTNGTSAWVPANASQACATTLIFQPTQVPDAVTVKPYTDTSFRVGWRDRANDELGYVVTDGTTEWSTTSHLNYLVIDGFGPGQTRCFRVAAFRADDRSAWSHEPNDAVCATIPAAAPAAPTLVTATANSPTSIKLTWEADSDSATMVRITGDTGLDTIQLLPLTSFALNSLTPQTTYCFAVALGNVTGFSPLTPAEPERACATTPAEIPASPFNVAASASSPSEIVVTWADTSTTETGFRVTDGVTTWTVAADATSFRVAGLAPSTEHCFRVQSFNDTGASDWRPTGSPNWACATTLAPQPARAPAAVLATAVGKTDILVRWLDSSTDETGFTLTDGTSEWTLAPNTTSFRITGLSPDTRRCFRVRAVNEVGPSAWAPLGNATGACATTLPDPPAAPTDVRANALDPTHVEVLWTDRSDNEGIFLVRAEGAVWRVNANETRFVDETMTPGQTRCYVVSAVNAGGSGQLSEVDQPPVCVTTPLADG